MTDKYTEGNCIIKYKGCDMKVCHEKRGFISLVEDGTFDVQEEDGHNDSCSFGIGHDSVLNL
jgi:hypothetical protein